MGSKGRRGSDDPRSRPHPTGTGCSLGCSDQRDGAESIPSPQCFDCQKNAQQLNVFGHRIWEISFQPQFLPLNIRLGTFSSQLCFLGKKKMKD